MSDQDDHEDEDIDEPRERRTEGVRIIGAQEAAAAAGRPDVVRRRRGGEKRYGDRPDAPPASDLPRITISTTEHDDEPGRGAGSGEPVARPAGDHGSEPQWRTEDRESGGRDSYGHARVVESGADEESEETRAPDAASDPAPTAPPEPEPFAPEPFAPEPDAPDPFEAGTAAVPHDVTPSPPASYEPEPYEPASYESESIEPASYESESIEPASYEPESIEPASYEPESFESGSFDPEPSAPAPAGTGWDPTPETDDPVGGTSSSIWEPEPLPWERETPEPAPAPSWPETPAPSGDVAATTASSAGGFDDDGDDSFILPHWTEPPTGQVPKVVIDEEPDPDAVASYGTQPRWRDEGERSTVADFDDLVDQGPGFGALARHSIEDEHDDDDFFSGGPSNEGGFAAAEDDTGFLDERDLFDDDFDEDDPYEGAGAAGPRGRAPRGAGRDGDPPEGSGGGDRNLPVAVGVGVALIGIGLLCFWAGPLPTALLATVVVTLCGAEYFSAVRSAGHNPASLLGIVAVAGVMFATFAAGLAAYPVVLGLLVIGGLLWFLWVAPGEGAMANLGLTLLGVLWIGVLGSFSTLFLGLGRSVEASSADLTSNPGIGVLIAAVIASVTHDVGAYFTGKYLGRTPLSAASPSKTQEGLAGGVIVSIVVTFVLVGLVGISPIGDDLARAFIFAVLCALVAPLGDLCESFIKRDLGIKDMGSVLPGHGGVLDRFDALLFVLPTAYFVTVLFEIWTVGAG